MTPLYDSATYNLTTAASSDPTGVSAGTTTGALPGLYSVAVSQLSTQGATNGQLVCDNNGVAEWCNPAATGVTSFNGRTGGV